LGANVRIAAIFTVTGLLLQAGLALIGLPAFTSGANLVFVIALGVALQNMDTILHPPPSPIFNSGNWHIEFYLIGLTLLTLLAARLIADLWHRAAKA
jgi:hypothetical protein